MLITNAILVNEGRRFEADLLIKGERIEKIAPKIAAPAGVPVLDAKGRFLLPGVVDDQVHFRDPGLTHKGDLASESAAAVAGGTTSFMDMPNVVPNPRCRASTSSGRYPARRAVSKTMRKCRACLASTTYKMRLACRVPTR